MICRPVASFEMKGRVRRSGLGSIGATLPKKLSSSTAARPVCESVEPIMPNLNGLVPKRCSIWSPSSRPDRAYSWGSISGVLATLTSRLPLSQVSKSANSSLGESSGWVSPSPFIWVTS